MPESSAELMARLGLRLKRARTEAGLSLAEVAHRVGRTVNSVWRLEAGQVQDPGIRLISRYLRACGKRWLEVADILDDVEMPQATDETILDSEFAENDKLALSKAVKRQVERYAPSQAYPSWGRPRRIEDQQAAVRRFAEYRQAVVLVEHDVAEFLKTKPVSAIDYAKYTAAARQTLGRLWRKETASARELARQRAELSKKGLNSRLAKAVQELVRRRFAQLRPGVEPTDIALLP